MGAGGIYSENPEPCPLGQFLGILASAPFCKAAALRFPYNVSRGSPTKVLTRLHVISRYSYWGRNWQEEAGPVSLESTFFNEGGSWHTGGWEF